MEQSQLHLRFIFEVFVGRVALLLQVVVRVGSFVDQDVGVPGDALHHVAAARVAHDDDFPAADRL